MTGCFGVHGFVSRISLVAEQFKLRGADVNHDLTWSHGSWHVHTGTVRGARKLEKFGGHLLERYKSQSISQDSQNVRETEVQH